MSSLGLSTRARWVGRAAVLLVAVQAAVALSLRTQASEGPEPTFDASRIAAHVRHLASEELEGRGAGTPGDRKAAAYVASQFRAAKLRPLGDRGGYFQRFSFMAGVKLGRRNGLVLEHGGQRHRVRLREEFMPLAFSPDGDVSGDVVFVGYGIREGDPSYDDYAGVNVKGKVVLALRRTPEGENTRSRFWPYAPLRVKVTVAREAGARAILFVNGPGDGERDDIDVFGRDGSTGQTGIPAATVARSVVERAMKAAGHDLAEVQAAINGSGRPRSFPLAGVRASLRVDVERRREQTSNVIGLVEGSDPDLRDEYVVVGAHYDHLGRGGAGSRARDRRGSIHYGADDNASGTAGLVELARHFAAQRPAPPRSLLFIAFGAEEIGLLGSAHFVRNPTVPLKDIVAMVNLDMVGRLRDDTVTVLGTGTSSDWKELLAAANNPTGLTLRHSDGGFAPSDQSSFYARDIPVLMFYTGSHPEYHTPADTPDTLNVEGEARLLSLVAKTVRGIASQPKRPGFVRSDGPARGGVAFSVYLGTLPDYGAEVEGVALAAVREGSPADKAGLKAGDVVVSLAGRPIRNVYDYTESLRDLKAGEEVQITVLRQGQRKQLSVIPTARPDGDRREGERGH